MLNGKRDEKLHYIPTDVVRRNWKEKPNEENFIEECVEIDLVNHTDFYGGADTSESENDMDDDLTNNVESRSDSKAKPKIKVVDSFRILLRKQGLILSEVF